MTTNPTMYLDGRNYHINPENAPHIRESIIRNARISKNIYNNGEGISFSCLKNDTEFIKVYIAKKFRIETYFVVVIHKTCVISKIKEAYFEQILNKRSSMMNNAINLTEKGFIKKPCLKLR